MQCSICQADYLPKYKNQVTCLSDICKKEQKRQDKLAKEARKDTARRKEAIKTRAEYIREAQVAFNAYIRFRDDKEPCISCGRTEVEWTVGGAWDCGHYLGVGAYPELRFEELNAHKQCKKCNGGSGKYAKKNRTVSQSYREKLIKKIGQEKVDWLEGPHEPKHYSIEELKQLKIYFRNECKELMKAAA